jgi:hypothetical protein
MCVGIYIQRSGVRGLKGRASFKAVCSYSGAHGLNGMVVESRAHESSESRAHESHESRTLESSESRAHESGVMRRPNEQN